MFKDDFTHICFPDYIYFQQKGNKNTNKFEGTNQIAHSYARAGHTDIVQLLLDHHPTVDLQTNNGSTALMLAVEEDYFHAVQILMKHKALLLSSDAELTEYFTTFSDNLPISTLVKQEWNWQRRKSWLLFWLALRRSTVAARSDTRARKRRVI